MFRIRSVVVFSVFLAWYSALWAAVIRVAPGETEKAISDASEAIRANPNDAKSYLARGKAYLARGQADNALADFDAAVKLGPADAEVYFHRATASQQRGLITQAIDDLTSAIRLRRDYAEAYRIRGLLFAQQDDILEALSDFDSVLKIEPENAAARSLRESVGSRLSALFRTSLGGGLSVERAGAAVAVQDVQKEIARQTAVIAANPRNGDAYLKRGMAYERLNDSIHALADASEALRLAPDNGQLHLRRALLYLRLRDREKATEDCEEALRLQPDSADAYSIRAILYIGDGQQAKGLAELKTAARIDPKAPLVYFNLGLVHEAGGEIDAAIAAYTEAIRLSPRDGNAFARRGKVYASKGDDALALKDFTQAISLAPTVVRAYQQRAAVYRKSGNQAAADRDLDLADFFQREASRSISYQTPDGDKATDAPLEVSLTPERWQALPGNIVGVNVGPDGRAWYEAQLNRNHVDSVAEQIARIQSQFARPAPAIVDSRIALFEPGGRAWFYMAATRVLLGYDGKTWLPRSLADENETLAGLGTTRGGLMAGDVNRAAGGAAWFLAQRGIYRFDGADWHYQVLGNSQMYGNSNLLLAVSADGQTAVAVHRQPYAFWIYRRGRWQGHLIPEQPAATRRTARSNYGPYNQPRIMVLSSLVLGGDGTIWMRTGEGQCRRFNLEGDEIASSPSGLKFQSLSQLLQDESGRIFLASKDISDGVAPFAPGMAIIAADGKAAVLSGADFERGLNEPYTASQTQVVLMASGKAAWLSFRGSGEPPRLLDFEKKQFVDALPRGNCKGLRAVMEDGRVFADIAAGSSGRVPILVYTPTGSAGRELHKEMEVPMRSARYAVTDDGTVWFISPAGELMRMKDASPPAKAAALNWSAELLPGHHGILLATANDYGSLYRDGELVGSGLISDLIEEHAAEFRQGFDPQPLSPGYADPSSTIDLTADKVGNIWWRDSQRRLFVWDGSRWHNAHEALIAGGSQAGAADWTRPLSDGSKIYVNEAETNRETDPMFAHSFQGELRNGRLHFLPAPPAAVPGVRPRGGIRDPQGGLWVQVERRTGPNSFYLPVTSRIDQTDNVDQVPDANGVCGVDRSGSIWLDAQQNQLRDAESMLIWRNGKVIQRLRVPGYQLNDPLASDRPGSVFVLTVAGLVHYVAAAPDYEAYRLQAEYRLPNVSGAPRAVLAAPPGYLSVISSPVQNGVECRLTLLKLPEDDKPQQH